MTVSEDDQLIARGANPRTGLITPFATSEQGSTDSGYSSDYVGPRPHMAPTKDEGSWQKNHGGWVLVKRSKHHREPSNHLSQDQILSSLSQGNYSE